MSCRVAHDKVNVMCFLYPSRTLSSLQNRIDHGFRWGGMYKSGNSGLSLPVLTVRQYICYDNLIDKNDNEYICNIYLIESMLEIDKDKNENKIVMSGISYLSNRAERIPFASKMANHLFTSPSFGYVEKRSSLTGHMILKIDSLDSCFPWWNGCIQPKGSIAMVVMIIMKTYPYAFFMNEYYRIMWLVVVFITGKHAKTLPTPKPNEKKCSRVIPITNNSFMQKIWWIPKKGKTSLMSGERRLVRFLLSARQFWRWILLRPVGFDNWFLQRIAWWAVFSGLKGVI